jgi:hypothetical protein
MTLPLGDQMRAWAPTAKLPYVSYQDDYIKRLLQKIGEVLARALGLGKSGQFDESVAVLEQGVGAELGMPFAMLLRIEPKSLVALLGDEKAGAFAEALRTRGLLFELAGRGEDARASTALADAILHSSGHA